MCSEPHSSSVLVAPPILSTCHASIYTELLCPLTDYTIYVSSPEGVLLIKISISCLLMFSTICVTETCIWLSDSISNYEVLPYNNYTIYMYHMDRNSLGGGV